MKPQINLKKSNRAFFSAQVVFTITILVAVLVVLSIWLGGLGQHRTIFENSIISTSILSIAFFIFIVVGLYKGVKIKEDIGKITDKFEMGKAPDISEGLDVAAEIPGGDLEGVLVSIVLWLVMTGVFLIFFWLFGTFMWAMILIFAAMLYWIFFRAVRLVFKNSSKCNGDLTKSVGYGFVFTGLYNFWIYGIILILHYFVK